MLEIISRIVGSNMQVDVDAYGGILCLWSRTTTREPRSLRRSQAATATLSESDLPNNWRDHIDVVTSHRAKVKVRGVQQGCRCVRWPCIGSTACPLDKRPRKGGY